MCKSVEGIEGKKGQALDWIRWISQVALVPVLGFLIWQGEQREDKLDTQAAQIATIEANRYTSSDHMKHLSQNAEEHLTLWNAISELHIKIAELPPDEFRAYVTSLEERLREVERRQ